jgi:hypothetical protein
MPTVDRKAANRFRLGKVGKKAFPASNNGFVETFGVLLLAALTDAAPAARHGRVALRTPQINPVTA